MRISIIQDTLSVYNVPLFDLVAGGAGGAVSVHCRTAEMDKWAAQCGARPSEVGFRWSAHRPVVRGARRHAIPSPGILRAVLGEKPDVIFIDGLSSAGTAVALLAFRWCHGIPVVWWSLGAIPDRPLGLRQRVGDALQAWCVRRCSGVISYGNHGAEYFRRLGAREASLMVGCNTIDERAVARDMAEHAGEAERLRAALIAPGERVALFCGTLKEGKGVELLLAAHVELRAGGMPVRLLIVGDGPMRPELEATTARLGVSGSVTFVGEQRRLLSAYMALGEFVVLPGLGGLAINHAFAHGLPVICGPADGMERDLVRTGETGVLLPVITVEALVGAMRAMLDDPARARRLGENACAFVRTSFSIGEYARRALRVAHQVCLCRDSSGV